MVGIEWIAILVWNHTDDFKPQDLKSKILFQTGILRREVQLHFIDQVAGLLKSGNEKAFTSHFVPETEIMEYRAKMARFKTEMTWVRTWIMAQFRTDVTKRKK